jgi:hypothetical protein
VTIRQIEPKRFHGFSSTIGTAPGLTYSTSRAFLGFISLCNSVRSIIASFWRRLEEGKEVKDHRDTEEIIGIYKREQRQSE